MSTRRAYSSDWRIFEAWCDAHQLSALPCSEQTLCHFNLARMEAGCSIRTVQRGIVSIRVKQQLAGHGDPFGVYARTHWRGLRNEWYTRPKKAALLLQPDIRAMVDTLGTRRLHDLRSRALVLVGFSCGMRQSEIVGLRYQDLQFSERGVLIDIHRSKTDQEGVGRVNAVAYTASAHCAVRALQAWLLSSRITSGYVFQTMRGRRRLTGKPLAAWQVCALVQKLALAAGLVPQKAGTNFSGHSLRVGFVTAANKANVKPRDAMRYTGHKSLAQFHDYDQDNIWSRCVTERIAL